MSTSFERILARVPKWTKIYVDHSFDISEKIYHSLKRMKKDEKYLAKKLGHKNLSMVNRWLTGTHNFTMKEIAQLEAVLGSKIVKSKGF
jgi:hypothetical protein